MPSYEVIVGAKCGYCNYIHTRKFVSWMYSLMRGEEMPARRSAIWIIGRGIVILLISGFVGATLVRLAPGFGIDEEALDPRLSAQSIQAVERQHAVERNLFTFYGRYLGGLVRGDAGRSVVFGKPIGSL